MTEIEMQKKFDEASEILAVINDDLAAKKMLVARYDGTHVVDATDKTVELLSIVSLRLGFLSLNVVPAPQSK